MTLIYTPVDIEYVHPNEQDIIDWFNENQMTDLTYNEYVKGRHIWATVACRGQPRDWGHFDCFTDHWGNNREYIEGAELVWRPGFKERFPELVKLIEAQPFKQIGGVAMIKQIGPVELHNDTPDLYNPTEPRRYLTYLTNPEYNTFHLTDGVTKFIPSIDDKYRCFAFNNTALQHGADWPTKGTKILLTTAGVVDNEKHEELIARSVEKFKEKVIYANI